MVKPKPPAECQPDKAEAEGSAPAKPGASPMDRFKSLAKGIVSVPPDKVREAQAEYEAERGRQPKKV